MGGVKAHKQILRKRPLLATVKADSESQALAWGLCFPEAPDRSYGRAAVFWHPDYDPSVLPVSAVPVSRGTTGDHVVDFRRLKLAVTVLQARDGSEYVLLCDGLRAIQLHVATGTVLEGPVRLSFKPAGMRVGPEELATLDRFAAIRRTGHFAPQDFKIQPHGERWLLALKVRPLLRADERPDYLQLARVLFPQETIEHWTPETDWIRSRIRRAIEESDMLVHGGYLNILSRANAGRVRDGVRP